MGPLYVFYDGWCPVCRRWAGRARRLDWRGRLKPISFRTPGFFDSPPGAAVDPQRVEKRLICLDHVTGRQFEGLDGVIQIVKRLPLLWPFLLVLWAARALGFGGPLYDFIAHRRTIIPVGACSGTEGSCSGAGGGGHLHGLG